MTLGENPKDSHYKWDENSYGSYTYHALDDDSFDMRRLAITTLIDKLMGLDIGDQLITEIKVLTKVIPKKSMIHPKSGEFLDKDMVSIGVKVYAKDYQKEVVCCNNDCRFVYYDSHDKCPLCEELNQ